MVKLIQVYHRRRDEVYLNLVLEFVRTRCIESVSIITK